jgi:hypothetical protein
VKLAHNAIENSWRGKLDVDTLTQAAQAFEITANRFDFNIVVP